MNCYFTGGIADGARASLQNEKWQQPEPTIYISPGGNGPFNMVASRSSKTAGQVYRFYGLQWHDDGIEYACYTSELDNSQNRYVEYLLADWNELD